MFEGLDALWHSKHIQIYKQETQHEIATKKESHAMIGLPLITDIIVIVFFVFRKEAPKNELVLLTVR